MDFGSGTGSVLAVSSSCMPFLKDLMPCAKSPINSEIFPRPPNSSRNRTTTTIQCQILNEPIGFSSASTEPQRKPEPPICSLHEPPGTTPRPDAGTAFAFSRETRPGERQRQGLHPLLSDSDWSQPSVPRAWNA